MYTPYRCLYTVFTWLNPSWFAFWVVTVNPFFVSCNNSMQKAFSVSEEGIHKLFFEIVCLFPSIHVGAKFLIFESFQYILGVEKYIVFVFVYPVTFPMIYFQIILLVFHYRCPCYRNYHFEIGKTNPYM